MPAATTLRNALLLVLPLLLGPGACRGGVTGSGAVAAPKALPNLNGTSGCSTLTPAFGAATVAFDAADLAPFVPGAGSGLCAKAALPVAYLAIPGPAPGPAVLRLDLMAGTMSVVADAGAFAAFDPAVSALSGIALLNANVATDPDTLLVVDSSTHRILAVSSTVIAAFAGAATATGGFAEGASNLALFRFDSPSQPAVGGDGTVYVPDPGNHRVRQIRGGVVSTIAGSGAPGFFDGPGPTARFERPDGIAIECEGTLVVTEASHRVRRLRFQASASNPIFGSSGITVLVSSIAGSGAGVSIDGSLGPGGSAMVDAPGLPGVGRNAGTEGTLFWLDRASGVLRLAEPGSGVIVSPYAGASVAPGSSFGLCGTFDGAALLADPANARILRLP